MEKCHLKLFCVICFLLIFCGQKAKSQGISDSSINFPYLHVSYSLQVPCGDLTDWFGINSTIGGGLTFKTRGNYLWGIDWNYVFGGNVKNQYSLLRNLYTSSGYIINSSGQEAIVTLYERGNSVFFDFGKVFPLKSLNPNSGIYIKCGVGMLMHKIRIDVFENDVPELDKSYIKGYDRFSIGPSLSLQSGLLYFGKKNFVNFHLGFEAIYGLTQNIRQYNFDEMSADKSWKNDIYFGVKLGWILPFYLKKPKDFYYY